MSRGLAMLVRVTHAPRNFDVRYLHIPLKYNRVHRWLAAIHRIRDLQDGAMPEIAQIRFIEAGPIYPVAARGTSINVALLDKLQKTIGKPSGGILVRADHSDLFVTPGSFAYFMATPSHLFWSVHTNYSDYRSADVFPGELLRALCILAPAYDLSSYFRQLIEADPIMAAECLKQGGFFLDEPIGGIVRPLPAFSAEDLLPLLSHEDRYVRETAESALKRAERTMNPRTHPG